MNDSIKVTSWNIKWLNNLVKEPIDYKKEKRIAAIKEEILTIDSDVLCMLEGVDSEEKIKAFCKDVLEDKYVPVLSSDGKYDISGGQYIWFLVKPELADHCSLLANTIYDSFAGSKWTVNYWGKFESESHKHFRHPQVLLLNWNNTRIECIGLHTKSKFVFGGKSDWNSENIEDKQDFIEKAIKARIKMTTEVANVRAYINKKFDQVQNPAIMVMGDLNDGPGKEYFETQYLFFDLLTNLQGNIFESKKFLNHALFDFADDLRWTCHFDDFITPERNPKILLDHILFTQPMVNGSLPVIIKSNAGMVEHEIHDEINAKNYKYAETSDHKPVSVVVSKNS